MYVKYYPDKIYAIKKVGTNGIHCLDYRNDDEDVEYTKSAMCEANSNAVLAEVRAIEMAFDELSKYIDYHKALDSSCNDNFHKVNLYHIIKDGLRKLSEHFS